MVPGCSVQLRTRRPCQNTCDLPLGAPALGGQILPSAPFLALPVGKGHCVLTQARRAVEGERQVERQAPTGEDEGEGVPRSPTPAGVLTPDPQPVSGPRAQARDVAALGCSLVVTREHRTVKF